jgi:phage-related protein
MTAKPLVWLGDSREAIRAFPASVRQIAGFQLWRVQLGLEPNDWKPMPSVGLGVQEIRVRTGGEHRVFYIAKLAEAVYVLHAFEANAPDGARRSRSCDAAVAVAPQPAGASKGLGAQ